jgi:endoglucanase
MIPNLRLRDLTIDTAKEIGVPIQFSVVEFGGYDTGAIHMHKGGVPSLAIGIHRHVHSHNAIMRRDDFDNTVKLMVALIQKMDSKTVAALSPE